MCAADSDVTISIASDVLRRTWRLRLGLAIVLLTIGGAFLYLHASEGWYLIGIGGVLIANSLVKLYGLGHSPRIELLSDRMAVWGVLLPTPRVIRYSNIRLIEWRIVRNIGLARVSTRNSPAFLIASTWLKSIDDFHVLVREFGLRLPPECVIDRRKAHTATAYVSMFVAAALFAIHTFISLRTPQIDVFTVLAHGAFSPTLVEQGEWFRLIDCTFTGFRGEQAADEDGED